MLVFFLIINLRIWNFFFAVFWNIPLQIQKKWHPKNDHLLASIKTSPKKCQYTLRKKKSYFWKICPSSHTLRFYPTHYNRTRFYQKTLMKLPFFIAISCVFQSFSESPYVSRIWFAKNLLKMIWNTLAK